MPPRPSSFAHDVAAPAGTALLDHGANAVVGGTLDAVDALRRAGKWVAAPPSEGVRRAATSLSKTLRRPAVASTMLAAGLTAPLAYNAWGSRAQKNEEEMSMMRRDTGRTITASDVSVDAFLAKTAAGDPASALLGQFLGGAVGGAGKVIGTGMANLAGSALSGIGNMMSGGDRQKILMQVINSDPVVHDAISKGPEMKSIITEAYSTMLRFAPTLALDVNAVRSFLRETVVMGGSVNYATIKNLVDTERSIQDAKSSR